MQTHRPVLIMPLFLLMICFVFTSPTLWAQDEIPAEQKNDDLRDREIAVPVPLHIPGEHHSNLIGEMLSLPVEDSGETTQSTVHKTGNCFAILFDGSQMQHLPPRREYRNDLDALRETLHFAGVPPNYIVTCQGGKTGTRVGFGNKILLAAKKAKRNDFILIAIQGYATHLDGTDYILPYDTSPDDLRDSVRSPEELVQNYRKNLIPVQAMLNLLTQKEKPEEERCQKILVLINPYSVDLADIAQLTVRETFPLTPFGHQEWILPQGAVVVTSRALRLVPERHHLLDASQHTSPRTTIFMRTVLEGLSGLARQKEEIVAEHGTPRSIHVGEFLTYLHNRSEIQDYTFPDTRFKTNYQFRMLPYFEMPPFLEKVKADIVKQVQINQYKTGLFLFFNQQDPQSSSIAFANCEGMKYDEILGTRARKMRFCSYLAAGDIPRLLEENKENIAFPSYIAVSTTVFDSPDGEPVNITTSQPIRTSTTSNSQGRTYSPSQQAPKQTTATLLPGDRIEVLEVTRTISEPEQSEPTETLDPSVDQENDETIVTAESAETFDLKAWELYQRSNGSWVRFRKAERIKMKSQVHYDENGQTIGKTDGAFEPIVNGTDDLEGWIPAESLNLTAHKYEHDKILFDELEKIRISLDQRLLKEWSSMKTQSRSRQSAPASQPSQGNMQRQTPSIPSVPNPGRFIPYVGGFF